MIDAIFYHPVTAIIVLAALCAFVVACIGAAVVRIVKRRQTAQDALDSTKNH